jgi:hypothetical protein
MMKFQRALIVVALGLSGCFLLSPDSQDQTMRLSIEARTSEAAPSKVAPCADPVTLLNAGPLHAVATVVELDPQQELTNEVAQGGLVVGPDVDGVRELTGDLAIPIGDPGLDYRLDVILFYDDFDNRSPSGSYFGNISFDTGLSVSVDDLTLRGGQTPSQLVGSATVRFRTSDPVTVSVVAEFDSANNLMTLSYQQDIEFEGEPRTAEVTMAVGFDPTPIYRGSGDLGSLQAGVNVNAEIELVPFGGPPVLVAHTMSGSIRVGFVDGDDLTEEGKVRLTRSDFSCDGEGF